MTATSANSPLPLTSALGIRLAVIADGSALCRLFAQLGYPAPESDFLRRLPAVLADPTQALLVAGAETAPVGCAHVGRLTLLEADGYAQLLALVVDETHRGKGVGAALVAAGEAWARAQSCATLTVRTNVARLRTHAFYERLGYARIKSQHTYQKSLLTERVGDGAAADGASIRQAPPARMDVQPHRLFHVSDRPGITRFEPRPPPSLDAGVTDDVVWAVSERLLHNYLLPRDCPRVTFYAGPQSTAADIERFFAGTTAKHIVAIEAVWRERVSHERLWRYEFPPDTFTGVDECAGYLVSRVAVTPVRVTEIPDILGALTARDVELRVLPSLWKLRDAIHASTLSYSFIRMRNAQPRPEGLSRIK